jgi:hypothetical protein
MAVQQGLCELCGSWPECVMWPACSKVYFGYRVKHESHIGETFFKENAQDGSIENLQTDTSSPAGVNGTDDIPVPPGWRQAYDEVSGESCYVNIAKGVKVCCKSLYGADCWKW